MSRARLSDEQLVDWLRLIRSENIGPRTFLALINRFGGAGAALEALPALAAKSLRGRAVRIAPRDEIMREMDAAARMGVRFIPICDADYPPLLREIADAPPVLSIRGVAETTQRDGVALVGSRNASTAGLAFAERLARGLGREGYVIVSGLARGIDAAAHRASLETATIAVLAGGQARPYPSEHEKLVAQIAERGLLVSEMPIEWEPRGRDFPRRNRIISGLSRATVVVEAARRSGSLITARFANEQGREIFAVPGSPLDPRAEGTNDLLRQGATLCARPEDVVDALAAGGGGSSAGSLFDMAGGADQGPFFEEFEALFEQEQIAFDELAANQPDFQPTVDTSEHLPEANYTALTDPRERVMSLLGPAPVAIDDLIRTAGLSARDVQGALMELDLEGRLERHGANCVALVGNRK
ncbi:DNA-processing protein DprA [Methylocystis sp. Sn-Cys]|uniref:DNA-processing protein DprA n=1 Tax=Methylocystis sp. Sn-Cys TaxID=1701263 RepID=UPI0019249C04|nr:DNA-processing protein DprA [Methylocystis sp. Sn-Cys]MBL1256136.1 DNA-protecting protein DprA [Methylocystis sp. Sn-Cys]